MGSNEIIINSPKYGDHKVIVDHEDYERLKNYTWTLHVTSKYKYAYRTFTINGKRNFVKMHRDIMGVTDSNIFVDHINHKTLDNRRANLRKCSRSENGMNREVRVDSKCNYLGVRYMKNRNKYTAQIMRKHLGMFFNQEDAARAYDNEAKKLFGEFANLNFN